VCILYSRFKNIEYIYALNAPGHIVPVEAGGQG